MKDEIKEIFVDYWEFANDASDNLVKSCLTFLAIISCGLGVILLIPVMAICKPIIKAFRKNKNG